MPPEDQPEETHGQCAEEIRRLNQVIHDMSRLAELLMVAKRCPHCEDKGWWVHQDQGTGEPIQVQCEWCATTPDSFCRAALAYINAFPPTIPVPAPERNS